MLSEENHTSKRGILHAEMTLADLREPPLASSPMRTDLWGSVLGILLVSKFGRSPTKQCPSKVKVECCQQRPVS